MQTLKELIKLKDDVLAMQQKVNEQINNYPIETQFTVEELKEIRQALEDQDHWVRRCGNLCGNTYNKISKLLQGL